MDTAADLIPVEVCYATPERQVLIALSVRPASTIEQAIRASGILARCPDIDLNANKLGIFGKLAALDRPVQAGDRIEIYRPLDATPQDARRHRAAAPVRR